MVEFYVQLRGRLLLPLSASDLEEMERLPERRILRVDADAKAPLKLKRWFFAMMQLLCEATGRWPTPEHARRELMVRTGYFESIVIAGDGSTRFNPQSMADWKASDWRTFLDRAIPYIIEHYAGETRAQFRDRVDAFLGIKLKDAWEE